MTKHIKYGEPLSVLVAVKGHPFDREAFVVVFEEMDGMAASLVDQPAAGLLMNPEAMAGFDALVLYDMPGLDFRAQAPARPGYVEPPRELREGFRRLLQQGKGVVALHHAIAAWPAWPEYAEYLGGRFLYKSGPLRGAPRKDSGYRHGVRYSARGVAPRHPVLEGLPERFELTDELYLYEVFEDDVTPLLRAEHAFVRDHFFSAELAVSHGRMFDNAGWEHSPGSNLIGWTKQALNSRVVYLQPGDGPSVYESPYYRRLVRNAIQWVAAGGTAP